VRASRRAARRKGFSRWREKVPAGAPLEQISMNSSTTSADSSRNFKNPPISERKNCPEMEFLDINLTKDSSLLLHAIHSLSTGGFLKKPETTLVLTIHTKKTAKQENSSLFVNSIL
jgi:hypothetical protein